MIDQIQSEAEDSAGDPPTAAPLLLPGETSDIEWVRGDILFGDGFESGDTTLWSATVP